MKIKVFLVVFLCFLSLSAASAVYAEEESSGSIPDAGAVAEEVTEASASVQELSPEEAVYFEMIISNQERQLQEFQEMFTAFSAVIRSCTALLFILVCFEILRIVKAWTAVARGRS